MSERRLIQIAQPATGDEEWQAMREPLASGWLTQGPKVAAFERAFAARHQVKHARAASSCTTALHLILAAMEIGPGDEVIVPAFTWVATANVVVYCGATPVFADIDRATFNIDPREVARKLTPRTRAIIAVHLFGLSADLDAIAAAAPGVPVIEDAACAAGSAYKGRPVGSIGYAAAFSFHPRKSITTGEGGMVTTNDDALAQKINMLRNHGASVPEEERHAMSQPYPDFNVLGYNYRMTDLQAAVGLVQLAKLDAFIEERQRWAEFYRRELAALEWLRVPAVPTGYRHGWQAFVCYVDETRAPASRNEIMERLQAQGVATRAGTHAVHMLGYYRRHFGTHPDDCPNARDGDRYSLAIPLHNRMSAGDYQYVVDVLKGLAR
jgi:dTDP-4-amino-4,6-dideoxygalactose transaminase